MSSAITFVLILVISKLMDLEHGYIFLKKKRVKLDRRSWQGIFIGYEDKNQYRVYNPRTGKVYITRDIFLDKQHLYHQKALNDWHHIEDDWAETDNTQFANVDSFGSLDMDNTLYSVVENTSKESKKKRNDFQELEQDSRALDDFGSK